MKAETYFKKYGEIYGIEQPNALCGYASNCIRFLDFEVAKAWTKESTVTYRFLGTKADSKHLGR